MSGFIATLAVLGGVTLSVITMFAIFYTYHFIKYWLKKLTCKHKRIYNISYFDGKGYDTKCFYCDKIVGGTRKINNIKP